MIDTGKAKEMRFDSASRMSCLVEDFISKASATQRAGRAGRVRAGRCFRLFSKHVWDKKLEAHQTPEMSRVPLEGLCLQIKSLASGGGLGSGPDGLNGPGGCARFLARALEVRPRAIASLDAHARCAAALHGCARLERGRTDAAVGARCSLPALTPRLSTLAAASIPRSPRRSAR